MHFADVDGWSPTASGLAEDARRLSAELDQTGARSQVVAAHEVFVALNSRFPEVAITNRQIRPRGGDQLAANDHTDWSRG